MLTLELLQQLENQVAKKQGRLPATIIQEDLDTDLNDVASMYVKDDNTIVLNTNNIFSLNDIELIATILHEGRHAYQWHQIQNPELTSESIDTIKVWSSEFENYHQYKVIENDDNNPVLSIEIDAISYTNLNIYNMTRLKTKINPSIQNLVKKRQEEIKNRIDNF
ncbi:MAG: hypothetical protein RBR50_08785 [Candidatus Izemoplasmatales bacterium]|nr:hypothetical protein [Candidatus Izemoplasmatales bacterium]